jgi:hypothetical protein
LKRNVIRLARFAKINKKEAHHPDWRRVYSRKTAPQMASPTVYITLSLLWGEQNRHNPSRALPGSYRRQFSKTGWSLGWVSAVDSQGRTIWIADAHRDEGKRFVVHADDKLTAFVELESAIGAGSAAHPKKSQIILRRSRHHHK